MLTEHQITLINDAIDMAIASNRRMQKTRPKYDAVFTAILDDLEKTKLHVRSLLTKQK